MAKKTFTTPAMQFISTVKEPAKPQESFTVPRGYKLVQESKSARTQILLRPTTKEALRKAAEAQGISLNELINTVLDNYIEGKEKA